jgi:hypothetical protein
MKHTNLDDVARALAARVLTAFPGWESAIHHNRPTDESPAHSRDLAIVTVTPPTQPAHQLDVVLRGNSVEVRYDDCRSPGPAEKLFVDFDCDPETASDAVIAFLRDLTEGRVVVARRRPGLLVRLMRGGQCESLAEFHSAREITAAEIERYTDVFRWLG